MVLNWTKKARRPWRRAIHVSLLCVGLALGGLGPGAGVLGATLASATQGSASLESSGPGLSRAQTPAIEDRGGTFRVLQQREQEVRETFEALAKLQIEIRGLKEKRSALDREIAKTGEDLLALEVKLKEAEGRREQTKAAASRRLQVMQENGQIRYFEVLFRAASFSDFVSRFETIRFILQNDLQLFQRFQALTREVETRLAEIRERQEKLKTDRLNLNLIETRLQGAALEKETRLRSLSADRAEVERRLEELDRRWSKGFGQVRALYDHLGEIGQDLRLVGARTEIRWFPFRLTIVLTQDNLAIYLAAKGSGAFLPRIEDGRLTFTLPGQNGGLFLKVRPVPKGNQIDLVAEEIKLDGIPISRGAWEDLLGRRELRIQARSVPGEYRISELVAESGHLVIQVER